MLCSARRTRSPLSRMTWRPPVAHHASHLRHQGRDRDSLIAPRGRSRPRASRDDDWGRSRERFTHPTDCLGVVGAPRRRPPGHPLLRGEGGQLVYPLVCERCAHQAPFEQPHGTGPNRDRRHPARDQLSRRNRRGGGTAGSVSGSRRGRMDGANVRWSRGPTGSPRRP